jgi:predicted kinase
MICTVGIPASGKSTWAREHVKTYPEFIRVERDIIRTVAFTDSGNPWDYKITKAKEKAVTQIHTDQIRVALRKGLSVIVSDTNLNPKTRHTLTDLGQEFQISVEFKTFDTPLHQAIKWNDKRATRVPDSVLIRMEQKMRKWHGKFVQDPQDLLHNLPISCVIMDIDGTLANMRGVRGPFEWSRVGEDQVIQHVADYAKFIYTEGNHDLVIFSGRDGSCRNQTEDWLDEHQIYYDGLHMRGAGCSVNDSILKEQLYMDHLHGRYRVDHVVDDRKQVCMMWESMGFRVMNCGGFLSDF